MFAWPQTLQDWAVVTQALAALAGLFVASVALRTWQAQGQTQRQQQLAQVTIHNYPDAPQFGDGQVEAKRP